MTATLVLALAGALTCWPAAPARLRVARALGPPAVGTMLPRLQGLARGARARPLPAIAATGAVGASLAGVGGAAAGLVLGLVVVRARGAARSARDRATATGVLAEGLGSFAAELRTGSPPAAAARAAARDGSGIGVRALTLVEATARLGGDVPGALRTAAGGRGTGEPGTADLRRFADAWALAERHGIGLAGLAEAVAVDLRARAGSPGACRRRSPARGPPRPCSGPSRCSACCSARGSARTRGRFSRAPSWGRRSSSSVSCCSVRGSSGPNASSSG